ncbi:deoxynucleoside kinase [Rhizosphaericola mali]|uniref:Deoxynucleoside kinase n=1 Tax=Rhizosphaericola mali TaxID=2545455 RepID=A0A5P2GEX2_9BACT|nr:deoxynucleoside kinase [Rhizosphaericola mali]QES90151.1 deoxynucleoside kinase [Rhizosphaericola mali]
MQYKLITIEGNIGAGKTTLAKILSERLHGRLILESFEDNPFLPKFYKEPEKYSFPLELFFMAERFKQLQHSVNGPDLFHDTTISDYVFIKSLLFAKVTLAEDEYKLYKRLFHIINKQLPNPDILIYLHVPIQKLQKNIQTRDRSYEQSIPDEYLQKIQNTYLEYLKQSDQKVLFVEAENADFLTDSKHVDLILDALSKDYSPGKHYLQLS